MKASELRICNYVTEEGRLILIHDGFGIDHAHNYEPIEITEEWLLKFGFEKLYDEYFISIFNDIDVRYYYNTSGSVWKFELDGNRLLIKYIHQLQNLYYALTRQELTFKK